MTRGNCVAIQGGPENGRWLPVDDVTLWLGRAEGAGYVYTSWTVPPSQPSVVYREDLL